MDEDHIGLAIGVVTSCDLVQLAQGSSFRKATLFSIVGERQFYTPPAMRSDNSAVRKRKRIDSRQPPVVVRVHPEFDKPIPVDHGVRPVAVRVRPEFDKAIPVDVGARPVDVRLWPVADRIDGVPNGAIKTFSADCEHLAG